MASVASQLIEEVTAHAQSNNLEDAREICADGTYFPNNLRIKMYKPTALGVGKLSRTQIAWKDITLEFVDIALILLILNRKSFVNWELGNYFRYVFNWMKTGKLILVIQEKYFEYLYKYPAK